MAGHPVAERAVEAYLDAVAAGLVGPRSVRATIIDELRDGLTEGATTHRARGAGPDAAIRTALDEFGPPEVTAAAFAGELASSRARRTVAAYLFTGPVVGLSWLLGFAPPHWWRHGPEALWSAVPVVPMIALAAVVGIGVLVATGRPSRWIQVPHHHILHGALLVVAAAALGDVLMLAVAARAGAGVIFPTIVVVAATASVLRLGFGVVAAARCLQSRRILTG